LEGCEANQLAQKRDAVGNSQGYEIELNEVQYLSRVSLVAPSSFSYRGEAEILAISVL
jgi:hypothetical protein